MCLFLSSIYLAIYLQILRINLKGNLFNFINVFHFSHKNYRGNDDDDNNNDGYGAVYQK